MSRDYVCKDIPAFNVIHLLIKTVKGDYYHTRESVEEYISLAKGHDGKQLIEKLKGFLSEGSALLEIGTGPGTDWKILSKDYSVTGSDISEEFLKHLGAAHPEGEFLGLDATTLITDKKFDGIYSNKVLHHLKDNEFADSLKRQYEILNPHGIICHSFWKGEGSEYFKGLYVNNHKKEEIPAFFNRHFEIVLLETYKEFEENDSILVIGKKKL